MSSSAASSVRPPTRRRRLRRLLPQRNLSSGPRVRRLGVQALLVAALSLFGLSVLVPRASASAEGCTWAPSGYVCNYTHGSGSRVDRVDAIRSRAPSAGLICNYSADLSVQRAGRVIWYQHRSHEGCTPLRAYLSFYPQRTFACGDVTSVAFFESGVRQGGYANIRLC